jgi:hypothetical protein
MCEVFMKATGATHSFWPAGSLSCGGRDEVPAAHAHVGHEYRLAEVLAYQVGAVDYQLVVDVRAERHVAHGIQPPRGVRRP